MVSFDTCRAIIRKSKAAAAAFLARKNIFYVLRKRPTCCVKNFVSDISLDTNKTVQKENKTGFCSYQFCYLDNFCLASFSAEMSADETRGEVFLFKVELKCFEGNGFIWRLCRHRKGLKANGDL